MKNSSSNQGNSSEPKLILNYYTERYINISPIFESLNKHYGNDTSELANQLDQVIKVISLHISRDFPLEKFQDVLIDLYNVRDMFKAMNEFKPTSI